MPAQPINPSALVPNPAVPTRAQMIDAAVTGIFASVFNTDGTTSVRLVQVSDDGKLMVGGDATALLETQRTMVVDLLTQILTELKVANLIQAGQMGFGDDLDKLRQDAMQEKTFAT